MTSKSKLKRLSALQAIKLLNLGSMITYIDPESKQETCLGYLMYFDDKGVYDATLGRVEVTKEQSVEHNLLLDAATINGLDEHCPVGKGNMFHVERDDKGGIIRIMTWLGTTISDDVTEYGRAIKFTCGAMRFKGIRNKDDCVFFEREE